MPLNNSNGDLLRSLVLPQCRTAVTWRKDIGAAFVNTHTYTDSPAGTELPNGPCTCFCNACVCVYIRLHMGGLFTQQIGDHSSLCRYVILF